MISAITTRIARIFNPFKLSRLLMKKADNVAQIEQVEGNRQGWENRHLAVDAAIIQM